MGPDPGFQAVILCGPGDSLSIFTSDPIDFPKALVPIANRPMVWYPLDWCYRMGIRDILLITPPESAPTLESALTKNTHLKALPTPRPTVIAPAQLTYTSGTAEIFRSPEVVKAIRSDFVILPCDLVCELDGAVLLQTWFTLQGGLGDSAFQPADGLSVTTAFGGEKSARRGGLGVWYPTRDVPNISVKKQETDMLATTALTIPTESYRHDASRLDVEQVVMSMPSANVQDSMTLNGQISIRNTLLERHGRVKIRTAHKDAHVYFMPRWTIGMMQNEQLDTVAEDVIGWWAKAGWQDGLGEKLGLKDVLTDTAHQDSDNHPKSAHSAPAIDLTDMSSTSCTTSTSTFEPSLTIPPMLAYIQPLPTPGLSQPLIHRADTTAHLLNISLYISKLASSTESTQKGLPIHPHSFSQKHLSTKHLTESQHVRISDDSLLGENVSIDSRVNVKECVIGSNCRLGAGSRLTRCVVMDNVVIGGNVTLTGCVLGKGASILGGAQGHADKTRLTDCLVQCGFVVEWGGEFQMSFFAVEEC